MGRWRKEVQYNQHLNLDEMIPEITISNPNIVCYRNEKANHTINKGDYIVDNWIVNGKLPDEVKFENGVITCNSTKLFNKTEYTIAANNTAGKGTLNITIMGDIGKLSSFDYKNKSMTFPYHNEIEFIPPIITGEFSGFELSRELPPGINFNYTDGHFYGKSQLVVNTAIQVEVVIINPRGNMSDVVSIKSVRKT